MFNVYDIPLPNPPTIPPQQETCSKLPATLTLFSLRSLLLPPHTIKVSLWVKITASPRPHNFDVHVLMHGSLGTRVVLHCYVQELSKYLHVYVTCNLIPRPSQHSHLMIVQLSYGLGMRLHVICTHSSLSSLPPLHFSPISFLSFFDFWLWPTFFTSFLLSLSLHLSFFSSRKILKALQF